MRVKVKVKEGGRLEKEWKRGGGGKRWVSGLKRFIVEEESFGNLEETHLNSGKWVK